MDGKVMFSRQVYSKRVDEKVRPLLDSVKLHILFEYA